jgi:hypothetical protein
MIVRNNRLNIQSMKLSEVVEADLKAKNKVTEKYWNSYSKDISDKLSFHPHIKNSFFYFSLCYI